MKEKNETIEELKSDKTKLQADFERLREQIIGVQYIIQYIDAKIKEKENKVCEVK